MEDLGVDEIFKKWGWGGMDWIDLAQDRGRWEALYECGDELPVSQKDIEFPD